MECLICQSIVEEGCLTLLGAEICGDCEARLMDQAVDEPGYEAQVRAFRLLWQRRFLGARDRHLVDGDHV